MKSRVLSAESRPALPPIMDYATFLAGLGDKDRASVERQFLALETKLGSAAAERWRRMACVLRTLAPGSVKLAGANAMQFFIPDGKYRKQVFALQALGTGACAVYAPDAIAEGIRAGILAKPRESDAGKVYPLGKSHDALVIDELDGKTPNPDDFFKNMTGWNRKAMRMTLPENPTDLQVQAVERLCAIAAEEWTTAST